MKNMKWPAYAKTGLVIDTKALVKVGESVTEIVRPSTGFIPAPIMPTRPAIMMDITLGMLSQERRSSVRGKLKMRVCEVRYYPGGDRGNSQE